MDRITRITFEMNSTMPIYILNQFTDSLRYSFTQQFMNKLLYLHKEEGTHSIYVFNNAI